MIVTQNEVSKKGFESTRIKVRRRMLPFHRHVGFVCSSDLNGGFTILLSSIHWVTIGYIVRCASFIHLCSTLPFQRHCIVSIDPLAYQSASPQGCRKSAAVQSTFTYVGCPHRLPSFAMSWLPHIMSSTLNDCTIYSAVVCLYVSDIKLLILSTYAVIDCRYLGMTIPTEY